MAPPGTKAVIHSKPTQRASWDPNGKVGWYIGPSLTHYRCMKCFLPKTRAEIDTDTIAFIPHNIPIPEMRVKDFLRQAASDIVTLLTHPPKHTTPTLTLGDETRNGILQLATLLNTTQVPLPVITKQQQLTANAARKLRPSLRKRIQLSPTLDSTTPSSSSPSTLEAKLQDTLEQLPSVIQQAKLARVLHAHGSLRKRYNPSQPFEKVPHFHNKSIRTSSLINHIYDDNGNKLSLEKLLVGEDSNRWKKALSNELGRLTQSSDADVASADAMDFIFHHEVPNGSKVTYANFVCDHRPLKDEPWRVRLVVGGDKLNYEFDSGSPAASLLETKILLNSVISDTRKGARFMSLDLKDFFLTSPMPDAEYMKIPTKYLPQDIINRYSLTDKIHKGYVYCKIEKGMYGLKQAAILAFENLKKYLAPHGYEPIPHTDGMWQHKTKAAKLCLCVDDFGVKYYNEADVDHLITALEEHYKISTDWTGKHFCGLTLDWHYDKSYVDVSMPDYISTLLVKYLHALPKKPQFSPFPAKPYVPLKRGQRQYAPTPDEGTLLNPTETTRIQQIVGSLLYYGRAIDYTILPALNTIAQSQAKPTATTKAAINTLLDYCTTYPRVKLRFHASDMVLNIDSDAAYLVAPGATSRLEGYFQLNSAQLSNSHVNAAILVECKTLRHVVASSAEAETAGVVVVVVMLMLSRSC